MSGLIWKDTEQVPGSGVYTGLIFEREVPQRASLFLTVSRTRRLCLRTKERIYLWARVQDDSWPDMWTLRPRHQETLNIVPPITSSLARRIRTPSGWMRWFSTQLAASNTSPIGGGSWQLTQTTATRQHQVVLSPLDRDNLPMEGEGILEALSIPRYECTSYGTRGIQALRTPNVDDARVKSWRKHVRDGTLPPVLLMWVRGLQLFVILDGHDRLAASIAEKKIPEVLFLWQVDQETCATGEIEHHTDPDFIAAYHKAFEDTDMSPDSRALWNEQLNRYFRLTWRAAISTARATTNDDLWNDQVSNELEEHEDRDAMLGKYDEV